MRRPKSVLKWSTLEKGENLRVPATGDSEFRLRKKNQTAILHLHMPHRRESIAEFILSVVPIPNEDAQYIASSFQPVELKKGELLLQKGQTSDDYIYLQEGLMRTYLYDLEGDEVTTDFFTQNNIVFEVTSFFNRRPSETYIQALTDCICFKINYEELNRLFHNKPSFRDFGRALLVREFIASKQRNYGMINQTADERYNKLLAAKPDIFKFAPLKYIASYLGITDSTLSRLRSKR